MDFTLDPNGKGVTGGRFGKIWLEDAEPTIKILDNGDVRFRYYAPEAKKVEVAGCGGYFSDEKVAMTKGEDGWWSCVISGIKPGFHNHKYWVDGNLMVNPDAPVGYGWFYPINVFDLPGEEDGFWMLKDVPHGDVRMEYYKSSATGRTKLAWVYTPAGYDESDKRYPVLYIQHGVGENEMGWVWQGHINMIADNLIAEGKMEEMIIVMNCGYAFVEGENPVFLPGDFSKELTEDCIPHIDAEYRTIADRKHRAMAGLSLGSSQAFFIANEHKDLFANLGVFSGGFPIKNQFGYWDYTDYYNDPEQVNRNEGRLGTFSPVTYLDRSDITVIRPMVLCREKEIIKAAESVKIPVIESGCPVNGKTERASMRDIMDKEMPWLGEDPCLKTFEAIQRSRLFGYASISRDNE